VTFLAPDEVEKDVARKELLKIIEQNLALAREIASLYKLPHIEGERRKIRSPADVAGLLASEMGVLDQEQMRVVLLNTRNDVMGVEMIYQGNLNTMPVRTAELFKEAVRRNAAAVILVHNHPSSNVEPSPEDLTMTRWAARAGELLGIEVLDHVIIGRGGGYRSLKESCREVWE
jgi:DNA repair protein RadC